MTLRGTRLNGQRPTTAGLDGGLFARGPLTTDESETERSRATTVRTVAAAEAQRRTTRLVPTGLW